MPSPSNTSPEPLLLVILGPTASGKSSLAMSLAQRFSGEIVSCDSVAVYRNFEIGTAKPSREDRARIPHPLIDVAAPGEPVPAGKSARQARAAIREISQRGNLPIVVGGTGLYLRALLEGLFPGPQRSDELRERLRSPANPRGPSAPLGREQGPAPLRGYPALRLGLNPPRERLYDRINRRAAQMFADGL